MRSEDAGSQTLGIAQGVLQPEALEAGIRAKDRASGKLQAEQGDCGVRPH